MIPAHVYNDPEIFAAERDRLFARSWVFLAHESEIPDPGDYVVRRVLADSFIVARDEAGTVRVMFNMCLHRGMQVCRAEMGNASHFRCPYHAWTYRNDGRLVGVPFHAEAYGGEDGFPRAGQSLLPAPSMGTHNGLIFISLDPDAPPLARLPRRLRVLPGLLHPAESGRGRAARPAAVADQGELEDRRGELRRRQLPHAAHPRQRGGHRPVPRAQGQQAQGGRPVHRRAGRGHHLQAARRGRSDFAGQLRYVGYPDAMIAGMAGAWSDRPARARGRQRLHGVGRDLVPEPEPGAQLAADRRRRDRGPVHLAAPVAAGQRAGDRGAVLVRGGRGRARGRSSATPTRPT